MQGDQIPSIRPGRTWIRQAVLACAIKFLLCCQHGFVQWIGGFFDRRRVCGVGLERSKHGSDIRTCLKRASGLAGLGHSPQIMKRLFLTALCHGWMISMREGNTDKTSHFHLMLPRWQSRSMCLYLRFQVNFPSHCFAAAPSDGSARTLLSPFWTTASSAKAIAGNVHLAL